MKDDSIKSLDFLFNPRNVAIFEASEKLDYFLIGLKEQNFNKNKLYLINSSKEEIFGLKCYKSF
ncbi:MAG: hypothetical protein ACFFAN_14845, partial [Promethearchaeota archaeon]